MGLFSATDTGSLAHISSASIGIGGAESNVAIGLSRLEVPSTWVGRIGTDSLGRRVQREITAEGVTVHAIQDANYPTGLMIKEHLGRNKMSVSYYRTNSAGSMITSQDVAEDQITADTLVHLTGITPLLSERANRACLEIAERAKRSGAILSFDVNYRSSLAPYEEAAEKLAPIAELADYVFGSPDELALLAPSSGFVPSDLAKSIDPEGQKVVVVKQGADGATGYFFGREVQSSGFKVDVLDPIGAGDSFVAGFLSGVYEGKSPEEVLALANTCGAITCSGKGDWESAPFLREIELFHQSVDEPVQR